MEGGGFVEWQCLYVLSHTPQHTWNFWHHTAQATATRALPNPQAAFSKLLGRSQTVRRMQDHTLRQNSCCPAAYQFYLYFLCCASTPQYAVLFPLGWYKTHLCYRRSSIPSVIYILNHILSFVLTEIRTLNWQKWISAHLELNTLGKENIFGYKSNSLKQRWSSISLTFASD